MGVKRATLDGEMSLHGIVFDWVMLHGYEKRGMWCECHEWLDDTVVIV